VSLSRARSFSRFRPGLFASGFASAATVGVSRTADACPFCGHGSTGDAIGTWLIVAIVAFALWRGLKKR